MEIKLNLVPPSRKKEIRKEYLLRVLAGWQVEIFLILSVFLVMLGYINHILKIEAASSLEKIEMSRQSFSYKDMQDYKDKVKAANARVAEIEKIQKGQLQWSELLNKINGVVSSGIEIKSLSTKNYQVFLTGVSRNRDDLAVFKENLIRESCFADVSFPLANLVNKEDLVFQMQFTVKEECVKTTR